MRAFACSVLFASAASSFGVEEKNVDVAPIEDGRLYRIMNVKSGLALDVMDSSNIKGMPLVQATPDAKSSSQCWRVIRSNVGSKLVNNRSGMAIDVPAKKMRAGIHLQQYPAHGNSNQQWVIRKVPKGFVILSIATRQAVSVADGSRAAGAAVVQWPWGNGREQIWRFEAVESP